MTRQGGNLTAAELDRLAAALDDNAKSEDLEAALRALLRHSGDADGRTAIALHARVLDSLARRLGAQRASAAVGAVALPAGAVALPVGAVALPAGAVALPAGAVALPAGAVALPAGAVALPAGAVALPAAAVAFRLVRNLCAAGRAAAERLIAVRWVPDVALGWADAVLGAAPDKQAAAHAWLQMLANCCVGCPPQAEAVWAWLMSADAERVWRCSGASANLVWAVVNQCLAGAADAAQARARREALAGHRAAVRVLLACIEADDGGDGGGGECGAEWAVLVLRHLLQGDLFSALMATAEGDAAAQLAALCALDALVATQQDSSAGDLLRYAGPETVSHLAALVLCAAVKPDLMGAGAQQLWLVAVRVLSMVSAADSLELRERLGALGVVGVAVASLLALQRIDPAPLPSAARMRAAGEGRAAPAGLKCDLLRLIGNCAKGCRGNQDAVREGGGMEVVLDLCRVDEHNPFQREWALFAVACLCGGNEMNKAAIAALEVQSVADEAGLAEMGLDATFDEHGKVRFTRAGAAGSSAAGAAGSRAAGAAGSSAAAGGERPAN